MWVRKSEMTRDVLTAIGKLDINPLTGELRMTARQGDLVKQMMLNKEEESSAEQVKKAEKVLSWINNNYELVHVKKNDGTHHGSLKKEKLSVKDDFIVRLGKENPHKKKFQAAICKVKNIQKFSEPIHRNKAVEEAKEKDRPKETCKPFPELMIEDTPIGTGTIIVKKFPSELTLRKTPSTQDPNEVDGCDHDEILKTLICLCVQESPWKTYHKVTFSYTTEYCYNFFRVKSLARVLWGLFTLPSTGRPKRKLP